jgi:predicted phosphate transport protein (TIGR00153 family)
MLEGAKAGNSQLAKAGEQIKALESKGDEITHDIFTRLNQTFITPLDPEDIQALSVSLDNVLDGIEDAAHRMVAYQLNPITPTMLELCEIVKQCAISLQKAFEMLDKKKDRVMEHCIEINRLENEADKLVRKAVADLFVNEKDPIAIIKLKEVYDFLEATTDYCEDVADTLQTVVVKHS